jgi:MYXO-CTERM domain-containing protein
MKKPHSSRLRPAVAFLGTVLAALLVAGSALAAGSFNLRTSEPQENSSGEWHIKVRIDLPRAPGMMHTPMRFTFSKEVIDERAIMSKGAEPVHHRNVLDTPSKQIVSLDVDFADASGKVYKSTVFEFDLARKDGFFEAGEYTMSINGPDGDVGGTAKLVLHGDNPPVYRGAMDFSDDSKKTQKKKGNGPDIQKVGGDEKSQSAVAQNDTSTAGPAATEVAPEGNAPGMVGAGSNTPMAEEETVKQHPSGCGCVVAGAGGESLIGASAALLGLCAILGRRRSRHIPS